MESTLFDRTFRDNEGNVVLGQMPNLPILVWMTATLQGREGWGTLKAHRALAVGCRRGSREAVKPQSL